MEMQCIFSEDGKKGEFIFSMDDKETYDLTDFLLRNKIRGNESTSKLLELLARRNMKRSIS
jgi:hypothetical protein